MTNQATESIDQRKQIINYGNGDIALGGLLLIPGILIVLLYGWTIVINHREVPPDLGWGLVLILFLFGVLPGWFGLCLLNKGRRGKALRNRIKTYLNAIINQNQRSIDNIASFLNISDVQLAMKNIQEIIDFEFLPGFKIDRNYRTLEDTRVSTQEAPAEKQLQFKITFNCKACGANNLLYRQAAPTGKVVIEECEYCGTGASVVIA